jgi:DNA-binding CsgD family transcriptional regulator
MTNNYINSFLSDVPADVMHERYKMYESVVELFPGEAVYVYSLVTKKMVFAKGWHSLLGYKDDEITLKDIVYTTTDHYKPFSIDLNEKALKFILHQNESPEHYSYMMELKKYHKDGHEVSMVVKVKILNTQDQRPDEIMGRFSFIKNMRHSKVMLYEAYGPEKSKFDEDLNKELFQHLAITVKEKEALELIAQGKTLKEVASDLNVSLSAIEKRILPLYKKFNVHSISHLIAFAHENNLVDS